MLFSGQFSGKPLIEMDWILYINGAYEAHVTKLRQMKFMHTGTLFFNYNICISLIIISNQFETCVTAYYTYHSFLDLPLIALTIASC